MIEAVAEVRALTATRLQGSEALPALLDVAGHGPWEEIFERIRCCAAEVLPVSGGLLFRGLGIAAAADFQRFATSFGHPLLHYEFASTPRHAVAGEIYTATDYPPHQQIPLHNEQSYTREWPMLIWFFCEQPAAEGGETPIADSRRIYSSMPAAIRERFCKDGLLYVRNYGNGLDLPWQKVFGTADRRVVESYCRAHAIEWEWKSEGELRTRQRCQAVARHPVTAEHVWFNQAHLFHISNLAPAVRDALLDTVDPEDLPRNVYFGDGSSIADDMLAEVRAVLERCTIRFPWQQGDVLMLDNMLTAHGRATFKGARRILVAMAQGYSE